MHASNNIQLHYAESLELGSNEKDALPGSVKDELQSFLVMKNMGMRQGLTPSIVKLFCNNSSTYLFNLACSIGFVL